MTDSKPTVPGESPFTGHHWWAGLCLASLGFIYLFWCPVFLWLPWVILGAWLALDDLWKHHRQKIEPDYLSPYNRLLLWLARRWMPGYPGKSAHIDK